jgi:TonB family protein
MKEGLPGRGGQLGREFKSYEEMETWKALNGSPPKLDWEGWKDRGEYDLYNNAMHTQNLKQKLNLLKTWRATYPKTNFLVERYRLLQETEAALERESGKQPANSQTDEVAKLPEAAPSSAPGAQRIWRSQSEFDAYNSPSAVAERKRQEDEAKREAELPSLQARWANLPAPPNCVRIDTVDIKPIVLAKANPSFSHLGGGFKGVVRVRIIIDENGEVMNGPYRPALFESTGRPGYDDRIIEAALKWRFQPAHRGGKPVVTKVTVEFDLTVI